MSEWIPVCRVDDVPEDGGACVLYEGVQIAIFHLAARGEWYAVQNRCPHWHEMVLWRGMTGEHEGVPKIACPMHKRAFSLQTGACLSDEQLALHTFAVRVVDDTVLLKRPAADVLAAERMRCAMPTATGACVEHRDGI